MINLAEVERAVHGRAPDALDRVLDAVTALTGDEPVRLGYPAAPDAGPLRLAYTRLAAALTAVLCAPDLELGEDQLLRLMFAHREIGHLFAASAFDGAEAGLLALFPDGLKAAAEGSRSRIAAYLALLNLDARLDLDFVALFDLPPDLALLSYLSLVSQSPVRTLVGAQRREALLEAADRIGALSVGPRLRAIVLISVAWMDCSYASGPHKHRLKAVLNGLLRRLGEAMGFHDLAPPAPHPGKPRMVVAAEIIHARHVQYRYFGQYLRQLRTRFHLVLLTEKSEVDAHVSALFDEVVTFERQASGGHLAEIFDHFRSLAPDAVFWLSVGMRHWGPVFANLRLAPLQFTAIGHSASTFCPTLDYYLIEQGYVSDPALFGERVLLLPDESLRFERAPAYVPIPPQVRDQADTVRIAVPSNMLKLNPGFLTLLGQIQARASRPVAFEFFPNARGGAVEAFRRGVLRSLKAVTVHSTLGYEGYLAALSACDLILSPFPFGGLHSVVDGLRQGLPVVAMERPEPHGMTDAMLLRLLGMPDWMIAETEDAYVAAALRVIGDDDLRGALSRQAVALDIDQRLFGDATTPLRSEVSDLVWAVWRSHAAIMASDLKALDLAAVQALAAPSS
ncbi:hypothetical protein [Phenylobacterium aquaticum]|uniref:hypothetical protein n=1 Tax=Phenylobacterium aquaticum TaxID=1763816 RepID=UPI0026E9E3F5|nr:hypothetical protein [Phenylobacterium aquaticum]